LVGAFLKYCLLRDWVAANAVEKIAHYRGIGHRRGSAPTLTGAQCAEIMAWAETAHDGALVPFIAPCLFAGIRPDLYVGEISKLEPKHVRLDTGVITIEPEVSKVRMKRTVAIQPNLAAWLRAYPLESFPIWPRGFKRLRLAFRKKFNHGSGGAAQDTAAAGGDTDRSPDFGLTIRVVQFPGTTSKVSAIGPQIPIRDSRNACATSSISERGSPWFEAAARHWFTAVRTR